MPYYVIADAREGPDHNPRPRRLELVAYRLRGKTYQRVRADKLGRVRLEPMNLLLGVRVDPRTGGDRLVLIDPATDQEIGDYAAVDQARRAPRPRPRPPPSVRTPKPRPGCRRGPDPRVGGPTERSQASKMSHLMAESSAIRSSDAS